MSRRKSAITIKAEAAAVRERTINARQPRDDGFLRRRDDDPLTAADTNKRSRDRKVWISPSQRWRSEMFIRSQQGAEWALKREEFIPITTLRPGNIAGRYQTKEG